MYTLTNVSNLQNPYIVALTSTVADAIAAASELGKIYMVEEDDMNPDHFDVITWQGGIFTIEPSGADGRIVNVNIATHGS